MADLLVISSAPAYISGDDVYLDVKFVEGMEFFSDEWDGRVECLIPVGPKLPFVRMYRRSDLSFKVNLIHTAESVDEALLTAFDVVLCEGDSHRYLHIADKLAKSATKLVYIAEYTLGAQIRVALLNRDKNLARRVFSAIWSATHEARRRFAFLNSDGIQANGYHAFNIYKKIKRNSILFLDSRLKERLIVKDTIVLRKTAWLLQGAPLRLLHSGRLEPYKGSQDLIPIARELRQRGIEFTLDIFGVGSLEDAIRRDINESFLHSQVTMHGAVDFETGLVPFAQGNCDIYVSCHRQSDPSCTYIESMGCGLAITGYANKMWSALCHSSNAGWIAPLADQKALTDLIADADKDRKGLVERIEAAKAFSAEHCFEAEFRKRIAHLRHVVSGGEQHSPAEICRQK